MRMNNVTSILIVGFLCCAASVAAGLAQYFASIDKATEQLRDNTETVTDVVELLLRSQRLGVETVAEALAQRASPAEALSMIDLEATGLINVLILDPSGRVIAEAMENGSAVGVDMSDRAYFKAHFSALARQYYLGDPVVARTLNTWVLPSSIAVRDENGVVQYIVATGSPRTFFDRLEKVVLNPDSGVFFRMPTTGTMVSLLERPNQEQMNTAISGAMDIVRDGLSDTADQNDVLIKLNAEGVLAFYKASPSDLFEVVLVRQNATLVAQAVRISSIFALGTFLMTSLASFIALFMWRASARLKEAHEATAKLKERLRLATDAADVGVWELDLITEENTWDSTMYRLYGVEEGDYDETYEGWTSFLHPDDLKRVDDKFQESVATGEIFKDQYRIILKDGRTRFISVQAKVLYEADGYPTRAIGVNFDITEQVDRERALEHARDCITHDALHDPLTSLGNRRGLDTFLEGLMTDKPSVEVAYLQIDLDRFKAINDVYGHSAGDYVLETVAKRLWAEAGKDDFVARIGGDEFSLILHGNDVENRATEMAHRIIENCAKPVRLDDKDLQFGASIGIAIGRTGENEKLFENADIALYDAKDRGRGVFALFTPELRKIAEEKKVLADELSNALTEGQLGVRLQPQVCAKTYRLVGAEALVRWFHPDRGELSPHHFLPIAEELGVLSKIDAITLSKALSFSSRLNQSEVRLPKVSVNVSRRRILEPDLLKELENFDTLPCQLAFELLETIDFEADGHLIAPALDELRRKNIEIELDDFGSGRASVTTLLELKPDRIKIDQRLTSTVQSFEASDHPLVRTICEMGRALNIAMTAEGIETLMQAQVMRDLGCETLQGYLFSPPLLERDFESWIETDLRALVEQNEAGTREVGS